MKIDVTAGNTSARASEDKVPAASALLGRVFLRLRQRAARAWPMLMGVSLSLAACGTPPGSFDAPEPPQAKISNLMAMVQFKKPAPLPGPDTHVVCPNIVIQGGTADDRVFGPGPQTNSNLRYQFSVNDIARDCRVTGNQLTLRVGVAGKILLGPIGTPGDFTAPVRVAVVREIDQDPIISKLYGVTVRVPADQTEASFTLVTESLEVPYTHANALHDYTIKVGFDSLDNDKRTKAMVDAAASAPDRPPVARSPGGANRHHHHRHQNPDNDAN